MLHSTLAHRMAAVADRRVPMIRFRYGSSGMNRGTPTHNNNTAGMDVTGTASSTATTATVFIAERKADLPERFRPRPISDEEAECILLGGWNDPVTPQKKGKGKK